MKIGIMTMWNAIDNYGGILQTYALQRYLRDLGHDAYDIRFTNLEGRYRYLKFCIKKIISFLHISLRDVDRAEFDAKKRRFVDFKKKYLNLSKDTYVSLQELQTNAPIADVYITGSDQVWARSLKKSINERAWYLDFGLKNTIRIAYAVSFGHSYCPVEDDVLFKQLVSRFSYVSTREINGIRFCRERGINAERCIDSTFLLSADHYIGLATNRKYQSDFAYLYLLNVGTPNEIHFNEVLKEINKKGYKAICTTASGYSPAKEIYEGVVYDYASVEEWLSNILYSSIFFTTSFHGIVFALMLKKQFIYLPLQTNGSGNDRVFDLLDCVKLKNRTASINNIVELMENSINYDDVDFSSIISMIAQSKYFLTKSLSVNDKENFD